MVPLLERHIDGHNGQQGTAKDDQHPQKKVKGIYDTAGKALHGEVKQMIKLA